MTIKSSIIYSFLIIAINILIGQFFAPNGITYTPIALAIMTLIIVIGARQLRPISKSLLVTGFIILHDIGIKLYSGGRHDNEGSGWIHAFLFLGLTISYAILLFGIFRQKEYDLREKIFATFILPTVILIHLYFFTDLGLGRYYWYEWNN